MRGNTDGRFSSLLDFCRGVCSDFIYSEVIVHPTTTCSKSFDLRGRPPKALRLNNILLTCGLLSCMVHPTLPWTSYKRRQYPLLYFYEQRTLDDIFYVYYLNITYIMFISDIGVFVSFVVFPDTNLILILTTVSDLQIPLTCEFPSINVYFKS